MPSPSNSLASLHVQGLNPDRMSVDKCYTASKGKADVYSITVYDGSVAEHQHVLEPLLCSRRKAVALVLLLLSAGYYSYLWHYWIALNRSSSWPLLNVWVTAVFAWYTFSEVFRQLMLLRAKRVRLELPIPTHFRVGMVVTKAPSEPWSVVEKTLKGMLNQDYAAPYEVWLADEAPSDDTVAWCKQHGVHISTRQGVAEYHKACWPRRTRCKEGNLAYFYDHYGYQHFDIVCQFDADHVPQPNYLTTLLPAFLDPEVGYVALPSICGANSDVSWAVRGRLYQEAYMHGPLGASCSKIALPCCIGSHYAVRTTALKEIGGIGPELNEDYSTSHIMTACGFKGVFGINTIANGDGPVNFEDCMRQEYQWARSAMVLITRYLGRYWPGQFTPLEMLRVVQANNFWLLTSLEALTGAVVAVGPCLLGLPVLPMNHSLPALGAFMLLMLPLFALMYASWLLCSLSGWLRPVDARFWSWELILHQFCKPWWILQGTVHGLLGGLLGINFAIKVTPKGDNGEVFMGIRSLLPFLACATVGVGALGLGTAHFVGPLMLCCSHLIVAAAVVGLHYKENHLGSASGGSCFGCNRFPWCNFLQLSMPVVLLALALCAVLMCRQEVIWEDVWQGAQPPSAGGVFGMHTPVHLTGAFIGR